MAKKLNDLSGKIIGNSSVCNYAKRNLSVKEFKFWITKVFNNLNSQHDII
jgi:hypothetical protein